MLTLRIESPFYDIQRAREALPQLASSQSIDVGILRTNEGFVLEVPSSAVREDELWTTLQACTVYRPRETPG